jgi:hypothetical protein
MSKRIYIAAYSQSKFGKLMAIDTGVLEETGKLFQVPKSTSDGDVCVQALKLIPGVQSAVRLQRKLEQVIQSFSPAHKEETTTQTSASCSSIALQSPRPE